jgi:hypothetical protein
LLPVGADTPASVIRQTVNRYFVKGFYSIDWKTHV